MRGDLYGNCEDRGVGEAAASGAEVGRPDMDSVTTGETAETASSAGTAT